jgi:hypothetical protein
MIGHHRALHTKAITAVRVSLSFPLRFLCYGLSALENCSKNDLL